MKTIRFCLIGAIVEFAYFGLMFLLSHRNIDFVGLRFVVELFTIPLMLALPVLLALSVWNFRRDKAKASAAICLLLLVLAGILIGSSLDI